MISCDGIRPMSGSTRWSSPTSQNSSRSCSGGPRSSLAPRRSVRRRRPERHRSHETDARFFLAISIALLSSGPSGYQAAAQVVSAAAARSTPATMPLASGVVVPHLSQGNLLLIPTSRALLGQVDPGLPVAVSPARLASVTPGAPESLRLVDLRPCAPVVNPSAD